MQQVPPHLSTRLEDDPSEPCRDPRQSVRTDASAFFEFVVLSSTRQRITRFLGKGQVKVKAEPEVRAACCLSELLVALRISATRAPSGLLQTGSTTLHSRSSAIKSTDGGVGQRRSNRKNSHEDNRKAFFSSSISLRKPTTHGLNGFQSSEWEPPPQHNKTTKY